MVESREAESTVAFISICDSNYVSRFLVMLDSLKKYIPKFTFFVVTLDNQAKDAIEKLNISNLEVVSLSDLDKELKGVIKSLQSSRKRKEFIFGLTPLLIKYLSKRDHSDYLVYVDADIYFKGNILEIMHIDGASVGIFKHDFRNFIKNLEIYGRFNVGVVYFNRGGEGKRALDWWSNKCIESTSLDMETRPDVFGDQKYLDYFPNAFKDVVIHDNHVFCKGPWNTNDLNQVGSSNYPYFFHFSGLEIGQRFSILGFRAYKWKPSPSVRNLYRDYVREIKHWEKNLKIPRKLFLDKKSLREWLKIIKYKDFLWFPDSKTLKRRD